MQLVLVQQRNFNNLILDTLPGQIAGGLNRAEVVLLALNPGFNERDVTVNLNLPRYVNATRNNHKDAYGSHFYYLDGGFEETAGYDWWVQKLKPLLSEGADKMSLKQRLMLIEYFPYHSKTYKHINAITPSQQFAFGLVREAINRNKTIVIMRSEKLWLRAVPELANYPYIPIKNPRNPSLSPKNLGEINFRVILHKLL